MFAQLDHLVVTTPALADGVTLVETALGHPMDGGGDHVAMGTHNRLMSMGPEEYLEVIAVNPAATAPGRPRFFDLDTPRDEPRLTNWVLRVPNLQAALDLAPPGMPWPARSTRSCRTRTCVNGCGSKSGRLPCPRGSKRPAGCANFAGPAPICTCNHPVIWC